MKNKYRILKIAITVIILGFLLSFSLKKFSGQKITDNKISVKMNEKTPVYFIDEKDIREIVKKENPSGKVGDLNIPALEKKINNLPAVDSANVYLNLNGKLNLDIKQRVPVFRLNKEGRDFYVDEKGIEFPISKTYSHPCMLVTGNVKKEEYEKLAELVEKIDKDDFSKKYFIGISKDRNGDYNLLTSLNPNYKENDSILKAANIELAKTPVAVAKSVEPKPKAEVKKEIKKTRNPSKPKVTQAKKTEKPTASKPKTKAKVKIE